jgi:hypothetical protein
LEEWHTFRNNKLNSKKGNKASLEILKKQEYLKFAKAKK